MSVIDADAHVIETERTWSFMLEEDHRFAPELLVSTRNGVEFWRIEDRVFPNSNLGLNVPEESRDLTDVTSRLAHMDSLGIDIQVLYPSLFLRPLTARAEVELALCRLQPLARSNLETGERSAALDCPASAPVHGPGHRRSQFWQSQRRLRRFYARLRGRAPAIRQLVVSCL